MTIYCDNCGKDLEDRNKRSKYCNTACKSKMYVNWKKEKEAQDTTKNQS